MAERHYSFVLVHIEDEFIASAVDVYWVEPKATCPILVILAEFVEIYVVAYTKVTNGIWKADRIEIVVRDLFMVDEVHAVALERVIDEQDVLR